MNDEMQALETMRSGVPLPSDETTRRNEARFMTATRQPVRSSRRRFAWGGAALASGLAAAVAAGVLLVPDNGPDNGPDSGAQRADGSATDNGAPAPALELKSAAQVLDLAATAAKDQPELNPRPDQAVQVKSTIMYMAQTFGADGLDASYLYRSDRTVWWPADGKRDGVLETTGKEPKAIPGQPIPDSAYKEVGRTTQHSLKICPGTDLQYARVDFAFVSSLPTTPEGMLEHLKNGPGDRNPANERAFGAAGDLIRETYLPPAQRSAVYRALGLIPGLELVQNAEDAAGRRGVAIAYNDTARGVRTELVFDPKTFTYLGERGFSLDPKYSKAPAGTQIASTALLSAEVVDTVPTVTPGPKGEQTCG